MVYLYKSDRKLTLSIQHTCGPFLISAMPAVIYRFFFKFYLFLAALGLHSCVRAFSSCGEQGLLFIAVHRLLIVVASLAEEHRL